jgi:hypothetical protein
MTTLTTVLTAIQTAMGALSGIKFAPDYPPENAADFPFVTTYVDTFRGVLKPAGDFTMLYNIRVELHVAKKDLPEDIQHLLAYPEIVANCLFKTLRDNLLAHEGIEGSFGAMSWDAIETIGFYWVIQNVKIVTDIT